MSLKKLYPFYIPEKNAYLFIDKDPNLSITFANNTVTFSDNTEFVLTDSNFITMRFPRTGAEYRFYNPYYSSLIFNIKDDNFGANNSKVNYTFDRSKNIITIVTDDWSEQYDFYVNSISEFSLLDTHTKIYIDNLFASAELYRFVLIKDTSYCVLVRDYSILNEFGTVENGILTLSSGNNVNKVLDKFSHSNFIISFGDDQILCTPDEKSPIYELVSRNNFELTVHSDHYSNHFISTKVKDVCAIFDKDKKLILLRNSYSKFFAIDCSNISLFNSVFANSSDSTPDLTPDEDKKTENNTDDKKENSTDNNKKPENNTENKTEDKKEEYKTTSQDIVFADFSGKFGNYSKGQIVYCSLYLGYVFEVKGVTILQNNINNYTFVYALALCGKYNDKKEISYKFGLKSNIVYVPFSFVSDTIV